MLYPALITILALMLYQHSVFTVGRMRGKYGIKAPATVGHPVFECYFRVQMNTLEQLIIFIPALWIFGLFVPTIPIHGSYTLPAPWLASAIGALWLAGRVLYMLSYPMNPEKRYPGAIISLLCSALLSLGSLIGILIKLYSFYHH